MQDGEQPPKNGSEPPLGRAPSQPGARASTPPPRISTPPAQPWKGIWRVVFAVLWVGLQAILVVTADRRADAAFGFRMFSESSTIKVVLYRELVGPDGQRARVHVEDGVWSARDAGGLKRRFEWRDRVRRPELAIFDREINASYSTAAQLTRLQAALDDLATHTPDDADTRRFLLDVTVRHNGGEPYLVPLASAERAPGAP